MRTRRFTLDSAWHVTAVYAAITLIMTWPLAQGLARDVPFSLGDPILNMWIMGWHAHQLQRLLSGDLSVLGTYWDGNIFHPHPLTLAYSEHLFPQALQAMPIYAATGNLILGYNLVLLSTFVLSGLGAYLFVRQLTGRSTAAFVAGLLFAFALFRTAQFGHLQVLSAQWMPFTLWGLRRYFDEGRARPLAGAALALVAQNLSCGYYLFFFGPVAGAYVLFELTVRRRLGDARAWRHVVLAAAFVALVTAPFLLPYLAAREASLPARPRSETERYSADVYSYLTAPAPLRWWGSRLRVFPTAEADLFPGAVPIGLGLASVVLLVSRGWIRGRAAGVRVLPAAWAPRVIGLLCAGFAAIYVAGAAIVFATGPGRLMLGGIVISIRDVPRLLLVLGGSVAALLALSPRLRAVVRGTPGSAAGFFVGAAIVAGVLSFGPVIRTAGIDIIAGPYRWLYEYLPGFDGLRVPARFAMIVALSLTVMGGYVLAAVEPRRLGRATVLAIGALFLAEAAVVPFPLNESLGSNGLVQVTPAHLTSGARDAAIEAGVASLPDAAVLAEVPLGIEAFDVLAMFQSTRHWRPLVNGHSGYAPADYPDLAFAMRNTHRNPKKAWDALVASTATHAMVHEWAYPADIAAWIRELWLERGATVVAAGGGEWLIRLPK